MFIVSIELIMLTHYKHLLHYDLIIEAFTKKMAVDRVLNWEMLIAFSEVPLSAAAKERILSSKVTFRKINSVLKGE